MSWWRYWQISKPGARFGASCLYTENDRHAHVHLLSAENLSQVWSHWWRTWGLSNPKTKRLSCASSARRMIWLPSAAVRGLNLCEISLNWLYIYIYIRPHKFQRRNSEPSSRNHNGGNQKLLVAVINLNFTHTITQTRSKCWPSSKETSLHGSCERRAPWTVWWLCRIAFLHPGCKRCGWWMSLNYQQSSCSSCGS